MHPLNPRTLRSLLLLALVSIVLAPACAQDPAAEPAPAASAPEANATAQEAPPFDTPIQGEMDSDSTFGQIFEHYEAMRLALTLDSLDGLEPHARELHQIVQQLDSEWTAEAAGIDPEKAEETRALLPALSAAAATLEEAESLEAARDAFYELSQPLVRYREAVLGERPLVAYCPMAKRSWLQSEGELGNPYYGQSMLRCGEVVDS